MSKILRIGVIASLCFSCENPFSPIGEYTPRLVVYSVLSNTRGQQFVRVSSTQDPAGIGQDQQVVDTGLVGADVKIISGASTYVFRDTLLQDEDSGLRVNAYVSDSLPIVHGAQYALEVRSDPLGSIRSTTSIPTAPAVVIPRETGVILDNVLVRPLKFSVALSSKTRRHHIRVLIEVETPDSALHRWEVPIEVNDTSFSYVTYPGPEYTDRFSYDIVYTDSAYDTTVDKIAFFYRFDVKFKNVVFEVLQIGDLEDYSSVVNGFRDELSLRADEPDFSNISGGFGYFGAYVRNEILRPFPVNFFHDPFHE